MQSGTGTRLLDTSSSQLCVVGGDSGTRHTLCSQLADHDPRYSIDPIDAAEPATLTDRLGAPSTAGVVYLDTLPSEVRPDTPDSSASTTPQIVVGDVDPAAAYADGATAVIPLAVADHLETVIAQIDRIIDRAHERRFSCDLLNETADGIAVHDPETGEIVACNDRLYRMVGYDPATDQLTLADLVDHDDEFSEARAVEMIQRAAAGEPTTFEWKDVTSDGDSLWVEVTLETATLGGSQYVVSSVRDTSDRRAQKSQLRDNQVALERLQEITANPAADLTTQIHQLLDFGAAYLGLDIGYLSRIDEANGDFEIVEAAGDHPLIEAGNEAPLKQTFCRHTLGEDADSPLVIESVEDAGMTDDPAYELAGLRCYMGAKVIVNDELYGTLCFADTEPRTEAISEMERTILDYMAQWLQQELERREYLDEVESARRRNQRLLERIDDAFFSLSDDWQVRLVNDAGGDVLRGVMNADYDNDELIGKHLWEEAPEAVDTAFYEAYTRAMDEQTSVTFEERYELLDEWFEVRAYPDEHGLSVFFSIITDRKEREIQLEQYETLFETVQEKRYVIDSEGYIELVSEPLAAAVGRTPAELEGEHISTITTETTETEREALEFDLLVTPDAVSSCYEGTLIGRDGTETPVEIEVSLLPYEDQFRGAVGAVRDISERRQREAELRVFQQAITEAGIGLTMYDDEGRFEYVNDHYAQLVGRRREALQSAAVWETVDDLSPTTFDAYWDSFDPNETRTEQTEHSRPDRSTVPVETTTTAVEIDGERHNLMLVQEVTGRRERRQQSEVLHRVLRHNLRNDLTVVMGRVEILLEELDGTAADHAEIVKENADSLLGTIEAAGDARDIIGHEIVRKPTDVVALLEEELAEVAATFDGRIETDLPDQQSVLADTLLRRGLQQLLTNAVEHNDADDPALAVRVQEAADRDGWIAIEIEDNGPGIPSDEIAVLTAGEETALHHGSGIGLWVVHWVVTRYGGELAFEVPSSGGSLVRITLPAAED